MRSLKTLSIPPEGDELSSALVQGTSLVLEALALHAIRIEDREHCEFQAVIRRHARDMAKETITAPEIIKLAAAAISTVENHSRETERHITEQMNDLRLISATIISALVAAYRGNPRALAELHHIEEELEKAAQLEDLRTLRRRLPEFLRSLGQEPDLRAPIERPAQLPVPLGEEDSREVAAEDAGGGLSWPPVHPLAGKGSRQSHGRASGPGDQDGITGLPGRRSAEIAIEQAIRSQRYWAAVPVVVDRIEAVNARFGSKTGDELLMAMVQTLAQKFGHRDELFRWQGPCFVALIEREGNLATIRAEMHRLLDARLHHIAAAAGRTILVPVSFCWTVVPLWDAFLAGAVGDKINDFLAKRKTGM